MSSRCARRVRDDLVRAEFAYHSVPPPRALFASEAPVFCCSWSIRVQHHVSESAARAELNVKYMEESRFCYGGAAVLLADGTVEGRRCNPCVYSGRWIHTITSYQEKLDAEFRRVKNLSEASDWVVDERPAGVLHDTEPLTALPGVGDKTVEHLQAAISALFATGVADSNEIGVIADLKKLSPQQRTALRTAPTDDGNKIDWKKTSIVRMSKTAFDQLFIRVDCVLPGEPDYKVDYREDDNPYKARFGDGWETKLRESYFMRQHRGGGVWRTLHSKMLLRTSSC